MKKMAVALLFVCSCSISHAQGCAPPADQYVGILFNDGRCFPWPKKQEKYLTNVPRCTPELRGQLESSLLPEIVNGEFISTKECVPIELLRRPDQPHPTTLDDLQRSIDELKGEIEQLKSGRH
jgi:hypothetical protein